jgi:CRISPR-associated exonuclease Cas4
MTSGTDGLLEVPISALEHFSYCERQCALIHVEQTFDENLFTIRGRLAHERVDAGPPSISRGVRILRSVPLWSERYGLVGKADVVEMQPEGPVPVEYKLGRTAAKHADVQLCAQALCLEEMFQSAVTTGYVYSHASKQRRLVLLDESLRERTARMIDGVRRMLVEQRLPPAPNDDRCPKCSLVNACLPSVVAERARLRRHQALLFVPVQLSEDVPDD